MDSFHSSVLLLLLRMSLSDLQVPIKNRAAESFRLKEGSGAI